MAKPFGKRALITGGAGFIGSRLARRLAASGIRVVVLDNLHPQVHGTNASSPDMGDHVEFIRGDVCEGSGLERAIAEDIDLVFHLAAETGTGQSYDEITRYCHVNILGTTRLIETLRTLPSRARRIVLAGSRAVYGEGAYVDQDGKSAIAAPRTAADLSMKVFDPLDSARRPLIAKATQEALPPNPASIYASTKLMQEYVLTQGLEGSSAELVLLRFQNVYGPGQSLRNPYTGVLSIFCQQILDGKRLNIYEDGKIARDFIFVDDVVSALELAGNAPKAPLGPINIGSGEATSILSAAQILMKRLTGDDQSFDITGDFRVGDVRHAVADITRAQTLLGWTPRVSLESGLHQLADWAKASQ